MRYYVALIHKEGSSAFGVSFPDFPGCVTARDTIEEAIEAGAEVLASHVAGMREDGDDIPEPRTVEQIRAQVDEEDFEDATVAMVPLLDRSGKPKAVNVSLDSGFLQSVDRYADAIGSTRSAVLTEGGMLLMRTKPASKVNPGRYAELGRVSVRRTKVVGEDEMFVIRKGGRAESHIIARSSTGRIIETDKRSGGAVSRLPASAAKKK